MISSLRKWRYDRALAEVVRSAASAKSKTNAGKRIAILSDSGSDAKAIDRFIQKLNASGRSATQLLCSDTASKEESDGIIYSNQKTWYGWPAAQSLNDFSASSYDILIVLATKQNKIITACLALIRAELKAGSTLHEDQLDLIVDVKEDDTQKIITSITDTIAILSQ